MTELELKYVERMKERLMLIDNMKDEMRKIADKI
jgi:hypothetical protein